MESYQSIGIILGIVGLILGLVGSISIGGLGLWVAVVSFIGIVVPLVNTKHHRSVGIVPDNSWCNREPFADYTWYHGNTI